MTLIVCQPGVWTAIPDDGSDTLIAATERGLLIDTTGALSFANRGQAYQLPGGQAMVVSASVITAGVQVTPANALKATTVRYAPV